MGYMSFKFICLNLWEGGRLFDEIVSWLREERADIIALQEVYKSSDQRLERRYRSLAELRRALGLSHYCFGPAFMDYRERVTEVGNGVLSKFPIKAGRTVFYDVPYDSHFMDKEDFTQAPRNLQHARVEVGGNVINVFNTQGIWGLDGDDNERRLNMARTIVKEIGDKENVVLAGDFNVREDTETVATIESRLLNIFRGELKSSFNMRWKKNPNFATAVVDMIFVSGDLKVVQHYVPEVNVSDHRPLVAVLEVS